MPSAPSRIKFRRQSAARSISRIRILVFREKDAMAVLVEAESLRKTFGPIVAVNAISLSVPKGEVLGFLGPNGAGKSTTVPCQ